MLRIGFAATSLFIFSSLLYADAQPLPDIAGQWKVTARVSDRGGFFPICSFLQNGDALSGSCSAPLRTGELTGAIQQGNVSWHWRWKDYHGAGSGMADFSGTLASPNSLSGTFVWSSRSYQFKAIKQ
jgi:hypothetical protein